MTATIFVLIVNPLVSAIFAGALFLLWRHQPQLRFVALLAVSFAFKSTGFALQFALPTDLLVLSRLTTNSLFLAATVTLCAGIVSRYGIRPPYRTYFAITGMAFVVLCWFLLVQPSFEARVIAINTTIAVACFFTVWRLVPVARYNSAGRLLILLMLAYGAAALIRQSIVLWPSAADLRADSTYWVAVTLSDLVLSLLLVLTIISGIAIEVFDKLRNDSERDSLSGLLNRRGFMERAESFVSNAGGASIPATLILADLDRFKQVNDTHGHDAGDRTIVAFAERLVAVAGDYAIVARLGGEEFAIFLPATPAAGGRLLADAVRTSFSDAPIVGLPHSARVTASFGVAEFGRNESLHGALRRADAALYAAKARGRDCTVIAEPWGPRESIPLPAA